MKKTLMIATSLVALNLAMPAMAEINASNANNIDTPHVQTTTEADIEAGWEDTKDSVSDAWENTKETVSDAVDTVSDKASRAYNETASAFDTSVDVDTYVKAGNRHTTADIIGKTVVDPLGNDVGEIQDIVLSENGQVDGYVVSHGGFFGIGSKDVLMGGNALSSLAGQDKFAATVGEDALKNYKTFNKASLNASDYLASELAAGDVVNPAMDELATVEDIIVENGAATKLIVSYMDGVLPQKAMMDFTDADIVLNSDNDVEFQLSMNKSQQFESFKEAH